MLDKKDMSALQFPSEQELEAKAATTTIKWSDLPTWVVYAIKAIKVIKGKYGQSVVSDLETEAGNQYRVWLPQRLGDEVRDRKLPLFVRPEGLQQSKKSSNKYYAYTLL